MNRSRAAFKFLCFVLLFLFSLTSFNALNEIASFAQGQPTYHKIDNADGSENGSLRQAIKAAEGTPGVDTIDLTGIEYITLDKPLIINKGNNINFVSDGNTTINGTYLYQNNTYKNQIMTVQGGANVTISGLIFKDGYAKGGDGVNGGGGGLGAGGALFIDTGSSVTLKNVTFLDNKAIGGNGGLGAKGGNSRTSNNSGDDGQDGGNGGGLNGTLGGKGGSPGISRNDQNGRGKTGGSGEGGSNGTDLGKGGGGGGGGAGLAPAKRVIDSGTGGNGGNGGNGGFGAGGGGGGGSGGNDSTNDYLERRDEGLDSAMTIAVGGKAGEPGTYGGASNAGEDGRFKLTRPAFYTEQARYRSTTPNGGNGGRGGGGAGLGGAIFVNKDAILTLINCVFSNNSVAGGTGGNNGQELGANIFNHGGKIRSNTNIIDKASINIPILYDRDIISSTISCKTTISCETTTYDGVTTTTTSDRSNITSSSLVQADDNGTIKTFTFPVRIEKNNGSRYRLSSIGTWKQAQAEAQGLGGNLVTINDKTENDWLVKTFGGETRYWIGYTNEDLVGNTGYKWVSGSSTFENWYKPTNEPNNSNGNQHYAYINFRTPGEWDDVDNEQLFQGIIENKFYDFGGSTYLLSGSGTWEQAQVQAQNLGGNLVTINSKAEQDWLVQNFGSNEKLWIGLTDMKDMTDITDRITKKMDTSGNREFRWANGESITSTSSDYPKFTNWNLGEPNNSNANEDYVEMLRGGKWNDTNSIISHKGIIEIKSPNLKNVDIQPHFFTLPKSKKFNVLAVGGDGSDIFQLESYDNLSTSQKVYGGLGSDIFNINVEQANGIVGLDFNANNLKKLADVMVGFSGNRDSATQRKVGDLATAKMNLNTNFWNAGKSASLSLISLLPGGGLVSAGIDSLTSILAARSDYKDEVTRINAEYNSELESYQSNLASIGNWFDGQENKGWGTVKVTQTRSVVEIMDFEPGIDIITLPKIRNDDSSSNTGTGNGSYKFTSYSDGEDSGVSVTYDDLSNGASTILKIRFSEALYPDIRDQKISESDFLKNLLINSETSAVIGKTIKSLQAVGSESGTGTIAGDTMYVLEKNRTSGAVSLYGKAGNDILIGRKNGENIIYAEGGDDQIFPGSVKDIVDGGEGDDRVDFSQSSEAINLSFPVKNIIDIESVIGTINSDSINLKGLKATPDNGTIFNIQGMDGDDTLSGSALTPSVIYGGKGRDILFGGDKDDILDGALDSINSKLSNPGLGDNDFLTGGKGNDRFILGNDTTAYYDDSNTQVAGKDSYADILDFNANGGDVIQLHGKLSDYRLDVNGTGTIISLIKQDNKLERIGIVRNQTNLILNGSYFTFLNAGR